ncbi:TetR/AcrR family transcriptional regulator [Nocardioides marmoribigeumensis]|uniref:AcrR family transcriptional regulator n=1 Tax=Nocardioides marmoribigeumensis TaxID=433649 RepID=A0ABU2C0M2_9ACTN|nr:TetR/AcrR family transcriptional regulator [Nocardioides marmoribigeumensis]MDR7364178.1 AcrR family transcriptional regulator [Nocardioides marmoribigeumensis]
MNSDPGRTRNPRGHGEKLRRDIVAAATALIEETGSEDAITLRGVARKVGISAPSVYGHFESVEAIVAAVVADAFAELDAALEAADGSASPAEHLQAVCRAYLEFARDRPHRYRVMFGRHRTNPRAAMTEPRAAENLLGAQAFGTLVSAVARTAGTEPDATTFTDATALWVAIHGYASLQDAVPAFPWPEPGEMLPILLGRLVQDRA